MARGEWNAARDGQFGWLAKSAGFRRNPQEHAGTGAIRQEKPQPRTVGVLLLVVAVDPGSIPCKCKPAKPCLTPATLEERCGSMDKPEAHPRFSARARIRPAAPNAPVSYSAG